jgi:hypothetical protein
LEAIALAAEAREHAVSGREGSIVYGRLRPLLLAALCAQPLSAQPREVEPPALQEWSAAEYPFPGLFRGIEADIPCELSIDVKGAVEHADCDQSEDAGYARGARDTLREARFRPARLNGQPAPARVRFIYRYLVNRERAGPHPLFVPFGEVHGQVLAQGTRISIAGADVIAQGLGLVAATDALGRWSMTLPRGSHVLVIVAPDFFRAQLRVEVGAEAPEPETVYLRRSAVSDLSITVPGEKEARLAPTKESISHEELRNVPGSNGDPVRVIENLPGLARIPYTGGQLIVRGAPAVDTGAYIDGQRIPILYHLLNGPSVLGEEMVDKIDFYPGGAGVYFGRNLAGVVAVQSRRGSDDRWHGSLAADLQKSAGFLQGPVSDTAQVAFGARRSYINPVVKLTADANQELTLPVYWDYQGRVDWRPTRHDRLSLTLYGSDDSFEHVGGGRGSVPLALGQRIGFHRARLSWERRLNDELLVTVAPMVGFDLSDSSSSGTGAGAFSRPQSQRERTFSTGLRAEASMRRGEDLELRAGVDLLVDRVSYDLDILYDLQLRSVGAPNAEEAKLNGVKVFSSFGEYAELSFRRGRLRLVPGLRLEELHWAGRTYAVLDPRLWARFELNEPTAIYAYAGLYHQAPTAEQVDQVIGNPGLLPQAAEQFGAGLERKFGDLWSIKIEGYLSLRRSLVFPAQPHANGDGTYDNPLQLNSGIGRSLGLEVLVRREFTERLYGWLAYTLSRSRELPGPGQAWRPTAFDQPHILTFLLGWRPSPYVEFATRVRIATGNPLAESTGAATFNADSGNYVPTLLPFGSTRLPTFLQIDFEINNIWVGDYGRLQLYLDFQNILGRRNPEALIYDFRFQESDTVHGLPFLASVGAKVSF